MAKKRKDRHKWAKKAELIADAFVHRKRMKTLRIAKEQEDANQTSVTNRTSNTSGSDSQSEDEQKEVGEVATAGIEPKKFRLNLDHIPKPSKDERRALKKERRALKREIKVYNIAKHANKHRGMADPYKKMEEIMEALGSEGEPNTAGMRRKEKRQEERAAWKQQMEKEMQRRLGLVSGDQDGDDHTSSRNKQQTHQLPPSDRASDGEEEDEDTEDEEEEEEDTSDEDNATEEEDESTDEDSDENENAKDDDNETNGGTIDDKPVPAAEAKILGTVYIEHPSLTATPSEQIDEYLTEHLITVTDSSSHPKYRPATKFAHLPLFDGAHRTIFAQFKDPTPIQAAAWPYAMAGRDIIGIAETGSGKTLAFGSPCTRHIASIPRGKRGGIRAVIITPTRELACQIFEYMKKLGGNQKLNVVCLYGGIPKHQQREDLKTAHIVVATPGRLQDLIDEGVADMSRVSYLVLDEADRMLEKGFDEAIRSIVQTMPKSGRERQTLMFTATWPPSIRELAATFMSEPVRIGIGDNPEGELRANNRITQSVEVVLPSQKQLRLLQILKKNMRGEGQDRILIFCLYKKEAFKVEVFLKRKDLRVVSIHGDLSQPQRTANLQAFKEGYVPILIATDVASRGLDIPNVNLVVNMTFPLTVEDYVHRIGR